MSACNSDKQLIYYAPSDWPRLLPVNNLVMDEVGELLVHVLQVLCVFLLLQRWCRRRGAEFPPELTTCSTLREEESEQQQSHEHVLTGESSP